MSTRNAPNYPKVIAIGASTGGPQATRRILTELPEDFPAAILVVQHMPADYTEHYAKHLNLQCQIQVKEAQDWERIEAGCAYVCPGDHHMTLLRVEERLHIQLNQSPRVNGHRPSVDTLFDSVAQKLGHQAMAVLLSGMGADGAKGMAHIFEAGGTTIAQDEASSVVFGMPRSAIDLGAVSVIAPPSDIPKLLGRVGRPRFARQPALTHSSTDLKGALELEAL